MSIEAQSFGALSSGQEITQFTLKNPAGVELRCINYGCRLTHLFLPSAGGAADVLLGYDTLARYEADVSSQGAFIGRYANRIEGGRIEVGGQAFQLPTNPGGNYLHGSWANKVFNAEVIGENSVSFTYISPDGEDGFPGEVWVGVTYTLTDEGELVLDYRARSTADTYINLTNHSYFNLAGQQAAGMEDTLLLLNCPTLLEAGADLCPTGRVLEAAGVFDFSQEKPIGQDIEQADPQLTIAGGYDHCFIIDRTGKGLAHAATARHPATGRGMRVYTTQPGIQVYTGNFLDGAPGKGGRPLSRRRGFCLETQHFPCSPSHPDFPTTLLPKGGKFHEVTVYQFNW